MYSTSLKKLYLLVLLFLYSFIHYGQMKIHGIYVGKNLFIQNVNNKTDSINPGGYCIDSLYLNDSLQFVSPKTSVIEVDLSNLNKNQFVDIFIKYKEGSKPKLLNGNDILSGLVFEFLNLKITEKHLEWFTQGELDSSYYIIEQLWLNNWIPLDTVECNKSSVKSGYHIPIYNLSGNNEYRVCYFANNGKKLGEKSNKYFSNKKAIYFTPKRVDRYITLSEKTRYQIYDKSGKKILLSGISKKIDCESLKGGKNKYYLLVIDNKINKFLKTGVDIF